MTIKQFVNKVRRLLRNLKSKVGELADVQGASVNGVMRGGFREPTPAYARIPRRG